MARTVTWDGTLTAISSIAHGGETRGTITQLRRELIVQPDGQPVYVPVVSDNSLRGRLRRMGEELLRDALQYEGELSLSAAHALRGSARSPRLQARRCPDGGCSSWDNLYRRSQYSGRQPVVASSTGAYRSARWCHTSPKRRTLSAHRPNPTRRPKNVGRAGLRRGATPR
jgi:hypothetical protein